MLRAAKDPDHPYLLLLDEMNLAHVERYFADVLSGMESSKDCLPNLTRGTDGIWRVKAGDPSLIPFPKNVWVVGTVNIDETTYMFSPKVLDRANTFEFRVASEDLDSQASRASSCQPGDQALVRGLLAISRDEKWHQENAPTFKDELAEHLRDLHRVLAAYGMEFGHRTFYESMRFAAMAGEAGSTSLYEVLDRIVLQKILPRMHGSRRRLERPLLSIARFARDLHAAVDTGGIETIDKQDAQVAPLLPASYDKVARMLITLRTNQFVSFAE